MRQCSIVMMPHQAETCGKALFSNSLLAVSTVTDDTSGVHFLLM